MRENAEMTVRSVSEAVGCTADEVILLEQQSGIVDGPLARRLIRFFVSMGAHKTLVAQTGKRHRPFELPVVLEFSCGAQTRAGTPCKQRSTYRNGRCKLHGGLSTGPKTEAGIERIREGQRRRRERERSIQANQTQKANVDGERV